MASYNPKFARYIPPEPSEVERSEKEKNLPDHCGKVRDLSYFDLIECKPLKSKLSRKACGLRWRTLRDQKAKMGCAVCPIGEQNYEQFVKEKEED